MLLFSVRTVVFASELSKPNFVAIINHNQKQNIMSDLKTVEMPSNLANELVGILYKNTALNFDMCAMNIVEIFQHLTTSLPQLADMSTSLIKSIQENLTNPNVNPDLNTLESNLEQLSMFSSQLQCGELNFYECDRAIEAGTEKCIKLLVSSLKLTKCILCCLY